MYMHVCAYTRMPGITDGMCVRTRISAGALRTLELMQRIHVQAFVCNTSARVRVCVHGMCVHLCVWVCIFLLRREHQWVSVDVEA